MNCVIVAVFAFVVATNCVYGEQNNTIVGEGGEGNATTPAAAFAVDAKANETAAPGASGNDTKPLNTFGDYLLRVSKTAGYVEGGAAGGNETGGGGTLPLLPRFQSFGDYLVEIAHNASLPGAGGEAGGNKVVALPLLPRFQNFGDYLVEIAHGGETKAEGGGAAGGIEEPADAGAPTWAPKCAGPVDAKAAPPAPVTVKDAPENCVDNHTLCPFWETRGWCKKGPAYMKEHCAGACDAACAKKFVRFAGEYKCEDKRPDCKERQAAGQCSTSPFFMIWQCSESCKFCLKEDVFVFEYSTAAFTCKTA